MKKITLSESEWNCILYLAKTELFHLNKNYFKEEEEIVKKFQNFLKDSEATYLTLTEDEPF